MPAGTTFCAFFRFLPPFLLEEKHVDKGIKVLKKLLGKRRKKAQSVVRAGIVALAN